MKKMSNTLDKYFASATLDMTEEEASKFKENFYMTIPPDTIERIERNYTLANTFFIFCTDVRPRKHYSEFPADTVCHGCGEDDFDWDYTWAHRDGDQDCLYCDGCDEDLFFFCEGCGIFYNRVDQCGLNCCVDCAAKSGDLFPDYSGFATYLDKELIQKVEKWIQENVDADYSYATNLEQFMDSPENYYLS